MKITQQLLYKIAQICRSNKTVNATFFSKLKRTKPKNLDRLVEEYHNEIFEKTECLECANCCRSISPALYEADIERLSKRLKIKTSVFKDTYTLVDEDNDYIFNKTPCPFLAPDNYCIVYEDRPKACREYPHTNRKRFHQILKITEKNMEICPVVFEIIEKLKKEYGS